MKKISREQIKNIVEQKLQELEDSSAANPAGQKTAGDVQRVAKRLDAISGLERLMDKVNTRIEFEQFIREVIKLGSKNVKPQDLLIALKNVLAALRKEMK